MIGSFIVIRRSRFYAQDQALAFSEINVLGYRRSALGVNANLQQRTQLAGGEDIEIAIQVSAFYSDEQIAGYTGESVEIIG